VENISFKDYLLTKARLKEALEETPFKIAKYKVTKYCKLELLEVEEPLSLKPSNELIIEWVYADVNAPTIERVVFITKESSQIVKVKRDSHKFAKWLATNCDVVD